MAYGDEDEVDWSDGSLDPPPSPVAVEAAPGTPRHNQDVQITHNQDTEFQFYPIEVDWSDGFLDLPEAAPSTNHHNQDVQITHDQDTEFMSEFMSYPNEDEVDRSDGSLDLPEATPSTNRHNQDVQIAHNQDTKFMSNINIGRVDWGNEDEVDWSDGTLDPPSPITVEPGTDRPSQDMQIAHDQDTDFMSNIDEEYSVPGEPSLEPGKTFFFRLELHNSRCIVLSDSNSTFQGPSSMQGARNDSPINHHIPSKEDYSNFVLYQANQKAYDLAFLNTFLAHALHPDRIAQCSQQGTDTRLNIEKYLQTVSRHIDDTTKKIIQDAHSHTIHLLADDEKHDLPFLNVHTIGSEPFADYGPGNSFPIVDKMNTVWDHMGSNPSMVQYSTKDYKLAHNTSPLEENDQVTSPLFPKENFGEALLAGRSWSAVRVPTPRKRKGEHVSGAGVRKKQVGRVLPARRAMKVPTPKKPLSRFRKGKGMCGAAVREERVIEPRNWLAFPQHDIFPAVPASPQRASPPGMPPSPRQCSLPGVSPSPRHDSLPGVSPSPRPCSLPDMSPSPRLCSLPGETSPQRHDSLPAVTPPPARQDLQMELVKLHKQRVAQRSRGSPSGALRNAKEVLSAAMAMGFRLTSIEPQEQTHDQVEGAEAATMVTTILIPRKAKNSTHLPNGKGSDEVSKGPSGTVVGGARQPTKKKRRMEGTARAKQTPTANSASQMIAANSVNKSSTRPHLDSRHPGRSGTLEQHQEIPSNAYFTPISIDDKPAWRCGINHALGYYYNAGDCKSCRGCNTNIRDNPKTIMDFYLPWRTYAYQPSPDNRWKPSKPLKQARKQRTSCHNSIAKDAFWAAIDTGATRDEALHIAVNALLEWLKPKVVPKEPTPEPEPEPEPEPDLGPHPSGSKTMEHDQDIPDGFYWTQRNRDEEFAWRCDVNHALGRYYLASDRKSCPGCGSSRNGLGKRETMDFYLPPGVIVRQEAPTLSKWTPRRPNKSNKVSKTKTNQVSHNQMCAKAYFDLIADGHEEGEALELTLFNVDSELDRREEEKHAHFRKSHENTTRIPRKRPISDVEVDEEEVNEEEVNEEEVNEEEVNEEEEVEEEVDEDDGWLYHTPSAPSENDDTSSDDEETSGSDSE
ncbi:hypothetical protein GMOD_00006883 [Pyrenophora seminiperda CCB06]|uniref:Uncharacterized protein n=1 Tax=Pyrenophora seminiperda CCB06 TaxID=1302712 RepID=A0A3M7MBI0_9PLEO|nr:hypothetical protein GMOD_00006883 [Pyrenophora seminiperda CCB06]